MFVEGLISFKMNHSGVRCSNPSSRFLPWNDTGMLTRASPHDWVVDQCHQELGNLSEAKNWTELALKMTTPSEDARTSFDQHFANTVFVSNAPLLTPSYTFSEAAAGKLNTRACVVSKAEEASELEAQLRVLTNGSAAADGAL